MKNVIIFQSSPARTASTVLINALYGIIPEIRNTRIVGQWNMFRNRPLFTNVQVLKSHGIDLDRLTEAFGKDHQLYFVCSERKEHGLQIDEKYKKLPDGTFVNLLFNVHTLCGNYVANGNYFPGNMKQIKEVKIEKRKA
jgi:hypothetical protein